MVVIVVGAGTPVHQNTTEKQEALSMEEPTSQIIVELMEIQEMDR